MEKSLAPRVLYEKVFFDDSQNIDALKKLRGNFVTIEYVQDFEAQRAARAIGQVLADSGWNVLGAKETKEYVEDGVHVTYLRHTMSSKEFDEDDQRIRTQREEDEYARLCQYVVDFLRGEEWQADTRISADMPEHSIRIRVGLKQNPYFLPKTFKEALKVLEDAKQIPTKPIKAMWGVAPWTSPPKKP